MVEENEAEANKLAEENQVTTKDLKEPQRVTMKNPKKVEAGRHWLSINCKKREVQNSKQGPVSRVNQYYGIGAVIAVEVIGRLGYYIY